VSLRDVTLRTRLTVGILAIAVVLVVPLLLALRSLDRLHESVADLRDREFAASLLLSRLRAGAQDVRDAETALLFVHDEPSRQRMSDALGRLAAMADTLQAFALDTAAANVRRAVDHVAEAAPREYAAALDRKLALADDISAREMRPAMKRVEGWLALAERSLRERTRERVHLAADLSGRAQWVSVMALLVAALLATGIGVWLTRSISRPMRDLERGMERIADGEFRVSLPVASRRRDEFGRLAARFQEMGLQLAELDKLKAEFVSVASHELKTPINVILGYLQLLKEGVYGDLEAKQEEVLTTIEAQASALARLVKQLLDISRFQAGGGKLEPRRVELAALLGELESAFTVLAIQRGVRFRVESADGLPAEVYWDPDRINEVLGNLLSNAFKFTPRGGSVELTVEGSDEVVQMEVRDTGAGIPPEQLPHIFAKFYQADNQEAAAQGGGTGLGLAISKEIVEAHGGTIAVDSTLGVGTTFSITLPARAVGGRRAVARALAESAAT
jgi:signal transduction histidine kinase